jgi:hypothetical protein
LAKNNSKLIADGLPWWMRRREREMWEGKESSAMRRRERCGNCEGKREMRESYGSLGRIEK